MGTIRKIIAKCARLADDRVAFAMTLSLQFPNTPMQNPFFHMYTCPFDEETIALCAGSRRRYFHAHRSRKNGKKVRQLLLRHRYRSHSFRSFLVPVSFRRLHRTALARRDAHSAAFSWFSALPTTVRFSGIAGRARGSLPPSRPSEGISPLLYKTRSRPSAPFQSRRCSRVRESESALANDEDRGK